MSKATATTTENILKKTEGVLKKVSKSIGNAIPAAIDPIDTIPVDRKKTMKTPRHKSVTGGWIARRMPNMAATPFPPLNPAKTGKI